MAICIRDRWLPVAVFSRNCSRRSIPRKLVRLFFSSRSPKVAKGVSTILQIVGATLAIVATFCLAPPLHRFCTMGVFGRLRQRRGTHSVTAGEANNSSGPFEERIAVGNDVSHRFQIPRFCRWPRSQRFQFSKPPNGWSVHLHNESRNGNGIST